MDAEAIRQRLSDGDIAELARLASEGRPLRPRLIEVVGHVAEGYGPVWRRLVDDAPAISELAEGLIAASAAHDDARAHLRGEGFTDLLDAFTGDVSTSSRALRSIEDASSSSDPRVLGRLARRPSAREVLRPVDADLIASSLAVAVSECLDAESQERCGRLAGLEPLMADVDDILNDAWRREIHAHLPHLAESARLVGYGASACRAKALTEAAVRTGRALQGTASSRTIFALGAAGLEALASPQGASDRIPCAAAWGAAAMAATYGFTVGWGRRMPRVSLEAEAPLADFDRYDPSHTFTFVAYGLLPLRFTWGELGPLAVLTVDAAAERLERIALSPRVPEWTARRYATLASAVLGASSRLPEDTSFARALGVRESFPEEASLRDGARLFRAAPVGRRPASLLVRGRGGREMRLHAAADEAGRLVGYFGLDPLSEEFHGVPERYVYDLDGWRQGRLVDGIYRKGLPRVKMMTAPEGIELRERKPA